LEDVGDGGEFTCSDFVAFFIGLLQFLHPQLEQPLPVLKHGHLLPVHGSPSVPFVAPVPHRQLSLFFRFLFSFGFMGRITSIETRL